MRIQSLEQVQAYVNVDNTFSHELLGAHETIALSNFINNYFSTDFFDGIINSDSDENMILEAQKACYGALISFSMYQWTLSGEVKIGSLGILRTENQEAKTAYSGQVKKLMESLQENGYVYVSNLISIIEKSPELFPDYEAELAFVSRNELIIKTTLDFNQRIKLVNPYLLFPLLVDSQLYVISSKITASLTSVITTNFIDGIDPEDENKVIKEAALKSTKNAIAAFTIAESFRRNLVRQTTAGIVMFSSDKDTDQQIYSPGDNDRINKQIENFEAIGNTYLSDAVQKLIDNNILAAPVAYSSKTFIA